MLQDPIRIVMPVDAFLSQRRRKNVAQFISAERKESNGCCKNAKCRKETIKEGGGGQNEVTLLSEGSLERGSNTCLRRQLGSLT